ncbi:MAG: Kazal-type serine protease inhibitor family protein [Reichenbachiella sp.]|uniref:Kazal-type serine protease inhibitor family protein n=1 Tax=Reichenbachiella sp. TaxID=2184521 RepID=UPI0032654BFB
MALFLFIILTHLADPCEENIFLPEEINDRQLIAIAEIDEVFDDEMINYDLTGLRVREVFKGSGNLLIAVDQRNFYFEKGKPYLIFANYERREQLPYISNCSKTNELSKIDSVTLNYLYNSLGTIPCKDPVLKEKMKGGACEKILAPVCGCDGRTYGNKCGMKRNGVLLYTTGKCE